MVKNVNAIRSRIEKGGDTMNDGTRWPGKAGSGRTTKGGLTELEDRNVKGDLDRLDPEGRLHLDGVGIWLGGPRLLVVTQEKGDVVGAAAKERVGGQGRGGRRGRRAKDGLPWLRGNLDLRGGDDLLVT